MLFINLLFLLITGCLYDYMFRSSYDHHQVPLILVRFYWNLNFLDRFSKNAEISNFMKIRQVGAELFHVDGYD